MSHWILIVESGEAPHSFLLSQRVHLVGSGPRCDLRVATLEDELFQLWRDGDSYRLVLMKGRGSVLVNGRELDEIVLRGGDRLDCAGVTLRLDQAGKLPLGPSLAKGEDVQLPAGAAEEGVATWVRVAAAAWAAENGKIKGSLRSRWEQILRDGEEWDWRVCTNEVLEGATVDDARLKSVVISLRDGMARRLIQRARKGIEQKRLVARLIVQGLVVAIVFSALFIGVLLARHSAGLDVNALLDGCLQGIGSIARLFS